MKKAFKKITEKLKRQSNTHNQMVVAVSPLDPELLDESLLSFATTGNLDGVKLAIANGASSNARKYSEEADDIVETALFNAVRNRHYDVVDYLLKNGAKVDLPAAGITPLIRAAKSGYTEIVKLLLNKDAKVNLQTSNGATALMLAAKEGHYDIVELLLTANANANIADLFGETALSMALSENNDEIKQLIEPHFNKGKDLLEIRKNARTLQLLKKRQGNVISQLPPEIIEHIASQTNVDTFDQDTKNTITKYSFFPSNKTDSEKEKFNTEALAYFNALLQVKKTN